MGHLFEEHPELAITSTMKVKFVDRLLKLVDEYKEAIQRDAQWDNGSDVRQKKLDLYDKL